MRLPAGLGSWRRRHHFEIWLPLITVFVIVKIVQIVGYPDPYLVDESVSHIHSAASLRASPEAPFGYPLFLLAMREADGFPQAVFVAQAGLRLIAILLLGHVLIRHRGCGRPGTFVVCCAIGLDPQALLLDHYLLADSVFVSLSIMFIAGLLAYLRRPGVRTLAAASIPALAAMPFRLVGGLYPIFLLAAIAVVGGHRRARSLLLVASGTVIVVIGLCAHAHWSYGVFRPIASDGWTVYGNIAPLLDFDRWKTRANDAPELRLVHDYFASFPASIYQASSPTWHRTDPRSPARRLVQVFVDPVPADSSARSRDSAFARGLDRLARTPRTGAQHLFRRYERPEGDTTGSGGMTPTQAFVLTNELLRTLDRGYLRRYWSRYVSGVFLDNVCRVFWPRQLPIADGRYPLHDARDDLISKFWSAEDISTWEPRFQDFAARSSWLPGYLVTVEWLVAGAAVTAVIARRRTRRRTGATRPEALRAAAWLVAILLIHGVVAAASDMVTLRALAPIMPGVVIATFLALAGGGLTAVRRERTG